MEISTAFRRASWASVSEPFFLGEDKDEEGERLAETRSSTPVLVHPRELSHSPDAYQVHRKSEMVILEES